MARSASTLDRSAEIYQLLSEDNCKAELILQYKNRTDTAWARIEDLDEAAGVQWGGSVKNKKPGAFIRTPVSKTLQFSVLNYDGEYCPEAVGAKAGVLRDGTRVKVKAGYLLRTPGTGRTVSADLSASFMYYTAYSSGIIQSSADPSTVETYFQDLYDTFGDVEYTDNPNYLPGGYFLYTFDLDGKGYAKINTLSVAANFTQGRVFYRHLDKLEYGEEAQGVSTCWTEYGATSNGTLTIPIGVDSKRFFQVAVIWDGVDWDTTKKVSSVSISVQDYIEWIYDTVYNLDEPSYTDPEVPEVAVVNCHGFDAYSRAIEADFNFPDLASGYTIDALIKMVCDGVGITYSATSIEDLTAFGEKTINPFDAPQKASAIFELLMGLLLRDDEAYEMYTEYDSTLDDDILFVTKRPTDYFASYVMSYNRYSSVGARTKNRDNLLRRLTAYIGDIAVDDEALIGTETGYTTPGDVTVSWVGDKIYKRYKITINSGSPVITLLSCTPTSMTFNVTGTFNIDVSIYGCPLTTSPTYWSEFLGHECQTDNKGYTHEINNEFITSDAEADEVVKGYIAEYGSPKDELSNVRWPYLHLLFETDDPAMIWSRLIYTDNIFRITGIKHQWSRSDKPNDSTQFDLQDTGLNYSDEGGIIYDRQRDPVHGTKVRYDYGFLYDMSYGVQTKESEMDFSIYEGDGSHDIGE